MGIKAIETIYKGHRFRSRLEARWAVFFDSLNIPYEYEPEGLSINGVYYLPDFYLPDCKQFFEVKGFMDDDDEKKINALISAGYSVTVGYGEGRFNACDYDEDKRFSMNTRHSLFCKCRSCGKYWFMGEEGFWKCQCCGEYDGNGHFDICMEDCGEYSNTTLWDVARHARFEHNETPRIFNVGSIINFEGLAYAPSANMGTMGSFDKYVEAKTGFIADIYKVGAGTETALIVLSNWDQRRFPMLKMEEYKGYMKIVGQCDLPRIKHILFNIGG